MAKHGSYSNYSKKHIRRLRRQKTSTRRSVAAKQKAAYSRNSYAQNLAFHQKKRRSFRGLIAAILIVTAAIAIGLISYNLIVNGRLNSGNSNASTAVTAEQDGQPIYTLIAVDAGASSSVKASYNTKSNTEIFVLMRDDVANGKLSYLVLPGALSVELSDYQTHALSYAEELGGDAELINAVNEFCEIQLNHLIKTDGEALANFVEQIGGLDITLSHPLDDPYAGNQSISFGDITLDKESALTLLRSRNVAGGNSTVAENLASFISALLNKLAAHNGFDLAGAVGDFATTSTSDLSVGSITDFINKMGSAQGLTTYVYSLTGASDISANTGEEIYVASYTNTPTVLERFRNGTDPEFDDVEIANVDTSQVTVEVRNGAEILGAGASLKERLEGWGYVVDAVGNTNDGATYNETLIVYLGDEFEDAANLICKSLNCGRVINGGDYYYSESDVIVIIGLDWTV